MKIKLFNIPALAILAVAMFSFRYGFLTQQEGFSPFLNDWQYALLVLSCVLIAAGGFLMNNTYGVGREDKSGLSEATVYNIYIALNVVGVGIGYYLANLGEKPMYLGIFVVGAATLYLYATSLKQSLLISNILLALIMTLPLVAIGVFNMYFGLTNINYSMAKPMFEVLLDYIIFSFIINLILTFINDLTNSDADYNAGLNTLPITLGRARTVKILLGLCILPVLAVVVYGKVYLINLPFALAFVLLFLGGPLVFCIIKLWNGATQKEFRQMESALKLVLLFTALSIAVISFNIKLKADAETKTEGLQTDTGIGFAPQAAVFKGA
ncbi:UbiA family prenyltransferase [Flavobacterium akiainvivens]|uniref:UbiA family prenyltransferase n=1 Tax=Flavobacterium akiainvivens TaxID=1202724 RepID=UPI0006C8A7A5|nr:UbiA family prenyltransferase [Flavobacterium akiainvivens]SFQ40340.1 4-hydroxybenzoate polyprenyltransferase [Flavobacterium akiainvivens]